jgi:Na+-transporting methylmalonyl-CoA/oxaloacetate decarboxylase gamma subunit
MHDLGIALEITVIGMGLVFGSIILLWGVMSLLMTITTKLEDRAAEQPEAETTPMPTPNDTELKRRAAIAAVAVALARESDAKPHAFPLPPTAMVSAWQSVMRGRQLKQRGPR